uniref:KIAA0513 n=1 Tax=Xiphophorus maculatus TaxID=8083 RepID=A0A3B5R8L5_XIPMA
MDNLIDFDQPSAASSLCVEPHHQAHSDVFSPEPRSSVHQAPFLPEPLAPTKAGSQRADGHNEDSDATESADSENDMDPPSLDWELRRSSSSSAHSGEDADTESIERRQFMKAYVEKVFHGKEDFDQEEKARFGELCSGENGKGREWFAKYVSAQRCHSKCVSEATFYRLVQSFAVVLFECYQMDDYSPAKNLMTMCFTYYYIGKIRFHLETLLLPAGLDSYLNKANSWLSGKKDAAERLLKNTSKTDVKGFFGGLESKLRSTMSPGKIQQQSAPEEKKGEKIYLYTHLKQQPIWHTLRFWNAAFFDAVHCERTKRSPTTREKWHHLTPKEREESLKIDENITFGQLGTFTHNMLAFGLSKKLCNDFLKKQAVIGNLNEGQFGSSAPCRWRQCASEVRARSPRHFQLRG